MNRPLVVTLTHQERDALLSVAHEAALSRSIEDDALAALDLRDAIQRLEKAATWTGATLPPPEVA